MKVIFISIKDKRGSISVIPEDIDDIWFLHILLRKGDTVKAFSSRKIQREGRDSRRQSFLIEIKVEIVNADLSLGVLNTKGKIISEHKDVKSGSYHTIAISISERVTFWKECWDVLDLQTVKKLEEVKEKETIAISLLNETTANIFLVTKIRTVLCQRIKPKNRKELLGEVIKCVLSEARNSFLVIFCVKTEKQKKQLEEELEGKKKKMRVLCISSIQIETPIKEILIRKDVLCAMKETKLAVEVECYSKIMFLFENKPEMLSCGVENVLAESLKKNIEVLLMTSDILLSENRNDCILIIKRVKEQKKKIIVVSNSSYVGDGVKGLGGICCIKLKQGHY